MNSNIELDLKTLLSLLKKHAIVIIAVSLIGFLGAYFYTNLFVVKKYTSDTTLIFSSDAFQSSSSQSTSKNEAARQMAENYIVLLRERHSLQKVADRLGVSLSTVSNAISVSQKNETQILKISATTTDPMLSAEICNALASIAPEILQEVNEGGSVSQYGHAEVPTSPSSPSLFRNAVIGMLLGFVLSVCVIILKTMLDNTVNVEDDIASLVGVAVLGEIPSFGDIASEKTTKKGDKA